MKMDLATLDGKTSMAYDTQAPPKSCPTKITWEIRDDNTKDKTDVSKTSRKIWSWMYSIKLCDSVVFIMSYAVLKEI